MLGSNPAGILGLSRSDTLLKPYSGSDRLDLGDMIPQQP